METSNTRLNPLKNQPNVTSISHVSGSRPALLGFKRIAASAGLSVSELKAEMAVDTAIVKANCRKNCPVIPEMNAVGTNTAHSTTATAITGPETSLIALIVASRGVSPWAR